MDKLNDIRQVKAIAVEAASRVVAENLGNFTHLSGNQDTKVLAAAEVIKKLATELEKHIWNSPMVSGRR